MLLSMHPSSFFTELNDSGLRDNNRDREIPTYPPGISGSLIRASTPSTSTGASPDDTSSDSPDWLAQSPPAHLDAQLKAYQRAHTFDSNVHAQLDDVMEIPKVEEIDEDLLSIKPTDVETGTPAPIPRKRGRPRKHPLPVPGGQAKITKGRSKTGCITCRRRKKKCDETKPA
jgi:hypothetical protein